MVMGLVVVGMSFRPTINFSGAVPDRSVHARQQHVPNGSMTVDKWEA